MQVEIIQDSVIQILDNRIKIVDSYKITNRRKMYEIIYAFKHRHPEITFNREDKILVREWVVHNRLYRLNYRREDTKDVDLEFEETPRNIMLYKIFGI